MDFLTNLVVSYLFEKSKTLLNRTTYHSIYQDCDMSVFKGKKSVQDIKNWLVKFQQTLNKLAGNQHFQFTVEIWKNDTNLPLPTKEDKVQVLTNEKFPFLGIKIS